MLHCCIFKIVLGSINHSRSVKVSRPSHTGVTVIADVSGLESIGVIDLAPERFERLSGFTVMHLSRKQGVGGKVLKTGRRSPCSQVDLIR